MDVTRKGSVMNVEIAQRLVSRRKQAGLSQEALAARLGVSRQAVSKWERSESSPDTDNLIALAQLYGVSLDDLLYVDDGMKDDVAFEAADRAADRAQVDSAAPPHASASAVEAGAAVAGDARSSRPEAREEDAGEKGKVSVGLGGIHVLDGDDYVHVSWREGVHVKDAKMGDEVHVGWNGIHVKSPSSGLGDDEVLIDGDNVVINGERFGSWQDAHAKYRRGWESDGCWGEPCAYTVCGERFDTLDDARAKYGDEVGKSIPVRKHYLSEFESAWARFPYPLVVILAYLLLGVFQGAWGVGLFLFFSVPLYYLVGRAISRRRAAPLVSGAYPVLVVGWFCWMAFVNNAPHPAWVAFLTIPLVEWLVRSLSRWWRGRKRSAGKREPIDVDAG